MTACRVLSNVYSLWKGLIAGVDTGEKIQEEREISYECLGHILDQTTQLRAHS